MTSPHSRSLAMSPLAVRLLAACLLGACVLASSAALSSGTSFGLPLASASPVDELSPAQLRRGLKQALKEKDARQRGMELERVLGGADSGPAAEAVVEILLTDDQVQVTEQIGIRALGRMQSPEALLEIEKGAREGRLPRRTRSIEALGRSQNADATRILTGLLVDEDARIRASAATSLGQRDEEVAGDLSFLVDDPEWTVRSAVIAALRRHPDRSVVPALCRRMREEPVMRLVDDLAEALAAITGERLGIDPAAYERWHAAQEGTKADARPFAVPPLTVDSPFVATRSRRLLFVLSTGETMKQAVSGGERSDAVIGFVARGGSDLLEELAEAETKLQVAQVYLRTMLRLLPDDVEFDVMVYASSPSFAFGEPTRAGIRSREKAEGRVASLSPGGGGNLEWALVRMFDPKGKDPLGAQGGPDTVIMLGDGNLANPGSEDPQEVAPRARRWNRVRQKKFLVLAVGQSEETVLRQLASGPPIGALVSVR